jgi:hypothetical protein
MLTPYRFPLSIGQTIIAMNLTTIQNRRSFRIHRSADARMSWRIKFLNQRLNIACTSFSIHIARASSNPDDLKSRIKQCQGQSNGVVDARITIDKDFLGHKPY